MGREVTIGDYYNYDGIALAKLSKVTKVSDGTWEHVFVVLHSSDTTRVDVGAERLMRVFYEGWSDDDRFKFIGHPGDSVVDTSKSEVARLHDIAECGSGLHIQYAGNSYSSHRTGQYVLDNIVEFNPSPGDEFQLAGGRKVRYVRRNPYNAAIIVVDTSTGYEYAKSNLHGWTPVESYAPDQDVVRVLEDMAREIGENAIEKGFRDPGKPRDPLVAAALITTEVAEFIEAQRADPFAPSEHIPLDATAQGEELADIIIRVLDTAHERGIKIGKAVAAKMAYNKSRPHKHGGKNY